MTNRFSKNAVGASLIGAPLLTLLSSIASPAIKTDETEQLAVIAAHPDRYYLFAVLGFAGMALLVPAVLGLARLTHDRAPRWGNAGATLSVLGAVVAAGDALSQLVVWQMAAPGADRGQMAALLERYDETAGAAAPFAIGGLAIVLGSIALAIGLRRARAVPAWAAVALPVGIVANIGGFAAASVPALIASSVVLLASMGWIGLRLLAGGRDASGVAVVPA